MDWNKWHLLQWLKLICFDYLRFNLLKHMTYVFQLYSIELKSNFSISEWSVQVSARELRSEYQSNPRLSWSLKFVLEGRCSVKWYGGRKKVSTGHIPKTSPPQKKNNMICKKSNNYLTYIQMCWLSWTDAGYDRIFDFGVNVMFNYFLLL